MWPKNTGIKTNSVEEAKTVLSFYEEEGFVHDSLETDTDLQNYPVLILDDYDDSYDCWEITGCKEEYYLIRNGDITLIDFCVWYAEYIGVDFEAASDVDMFEFLVS